MGGNLIETYPKLIFGTTRKSTDKAVFFLGGEGGGLGLDYTPFISANLTFFILKLLVSNIQNACLERKLLYQDLFDFFH